MTDSGQRGGAPPQEESLVKKVVTVRQRRRPPAHLPCGSRQFAAVAGAAAGRLLPCCRRIQGSWQRSDFLVRLSQQPKQKSPLPLNRPPNRPTCTWPSGSGSAAWSSCTTSTSWSVWRLEVLAADYCLHVSSLGASILLLFTHPAPIHPPYSPSTALPCFALHPHACTPGASPTPSR